MINITNEGENITGKLLHLSPKDKEVEDKLYKWTKRKYYFHYGRSK
jgi:hypothetical protein